MHNILKELREKTDLLITKKRLISLLQATYKHGVQPTITVTTADFHTLKYIPCLFFIFLIPIVCRYKFFPVCAGDSLYVIQ